MRRNAILSVVLFLVAVTAAILLDRDKRQRWPADSPEGMSVARVNAFIASAHKAEVRAGQYGRSHTPTRDSSFVTGQFARYHEDLKTSVAIHCANDCWKGLGGSIGSPPTFDPRHQIVFDVERLKDGRIEVHVRDDRSATSPNDVIFQLEQVDDEWLVNHFFDVGRGPRDPYPPTSEFPSPPRTLQLPENELDIDSLIPALAEHQRRAIALHPFRDPVVPADSSHFGGLMLGNTSDDWPRCKLHNSNHIGVLQLLKKDYPELEFRERTDVFQLTWCPFDHDFGLPDVEVRWLRRAELPATQESNPKHRWPYYDYMPEPCRVYSDVITEYPGWGEDAMDEPMEDAICGCEASQMHAVRHGKTLSRDDVLTDFHQWFGPYEGTKLLGHPAWIQSPETPVCPSCEKPMQLLISIQSSEPWYHEKERRQPTGLIPGTPGATTALMIGDMGCAYIFICRECPDWPIVALMQCS